MAAFDGVRVLDFTHVLAGPFCTYQLAVMGADVIKVEAPGLPDMMRDEGPVEQMNKEGRGTAFVSQNGNKRSLSLDLATRDGKRIALELVKTADVLVENYRRGAMERNGLGYEACRASNPKLIYCSLTGYGHTGPKRDHPAYDLVIQGFSGLMAATGTPEVHPVRVGPAVLDFGTGAQAAFAIASALFQRTHTGTGQKIDVAMSDAALMLMSNHVTEAQALKESPPPFGNNHPSRAGYSVYQTADGLLAVGAVTVQQVQNMWCALEREDIVDDLEGLGRESLGRWRDAHKTLLEGVLGMRPATHWETLLNEAGVPAARVQRVDEALEHPQVRSRSVLHEGEVLPETGEPLRVPVAAFNYAHGGPEHRSPAPKLGEHSREVLREAGYRDEEIDRLCKSGVVLTSGD